MENKQTIAKNDSPPARVRLKKGRVVSDRMEKTVVVAVVRYKVHPLYRKRYKVTKRFKAHNPGNKYRQGDLVNIQETRPLSKEKRWIVIGRWQAGQSESL